MSDVGGNEGHEETCTSDMNEPVSYVSGLEATLEESRMVTYDLESMEEDLRIPDLGDQPNNALAQIFDASALHFDILSDHNLNIEPGGELEMLLPTDPVSDHYSSQRKFTRIDGGQNVTNLSPSSPHDNRHSLWGNSTTNSMVKDDTSWPKTLEKLKVLEDSAFWSKWLSQIHFQTTDSDDRDNTPLPCDIISRDRMLSITQGIWRTTTQELRQSWPSNQHNESNAWMDRIILLPSAAIMQLIRKRYLQQDNTQFPLLYDHQDPRLETPTGTENPLLCGLTTLLVLARITQSSPIVEARDLSNGLISLCLRFLERMEWGTCVAQSCIPLALIQLLQWSGEAHQTIVSQILHFSQGTKTILTRTLVRS
jgi:hypothetical protein